MFYLVKVLIGRAVISLDRAFSYYTYDPSITLGMRVMVSFGPSKSTIGFVVEKPVKIEKDILEYQEEIGIKMHEIQKKVDDVAILDDNLMKLAKNISSYYKADLIQVLQSMLPPSLKPKDSALKKAQGKTVSFIFAKENVPLSLSKRESELFDKIRKEIDGIRKSEITAKTSLKKLLELNAVEERQIPVYRIPEIQAKKMLPVDLTVEQEQVYETVKNSFDKVYLLQGVTGSGKTEVYLHLTETYFKEGKGVIVLVPEIALTDQMAYLFKAKFKDSISILNSSLSDSRKYDEYQRILSGESRIVLGTRSAIFAPVHNLALIVIDEEHSSSYKQDNVPCYDALTVSKMRVNIEGCKLLLSSATPRVEDKAKAEKGLYKELFMRKRIAKNQDKEIIMVNMNDPHALDPRKSSLISVRLIDEIEKTLERKEQAMILINRRGYSPIYVCRSCHKTRICPNCSIPLNYHKRDDTLVCHHCGYKESTIGLTCECSCTDFLKLGYGTERAYEELRSFFPNARITRLDSDVSSNEVRHEILQDFKDGESDIIVGTEVISKGHDFPKVTLAAILDCDSSLRIPSYLANEDTFDLISQFVGRAGRKELKGRVLLQSYCPDNKVIQLASKQDYDAFYQMEMEERKRYQYPPYTYLASITMKGVDLKEVNRVSLLVKEFLVNEIGNKKFNVYGPNAPYIPHVNGRYYRTILLKYKSVAEASEVLDGLKVIRNQNEAVSITVNVDPGRDSN